MITALPGACPGLHDAQARPATVAAPMHTQADNPAPAGSGCARLRALLLSPQLEFLLEAHNGVSARIVEQAGFAGIWASGLAISSQFGVRDSNEASWTQVVEMLEFMADATQVPILLDGDTGYGNFNNMRRLVRKLEQRGIAGVAIEDKQFPKTNSFIDGEHQPLAGMDEFCGKIKAGKDSQRDDDFCIVARVEALIAGWGMAEALRRAAAYHDAGADAILIHSKRSRADEVLAFAREWAGRAPLVIIPTTYYGTPTEVFRRAGISTVIWANHTLRAAIAAMQTVSREIHRRQSVAAVEDRIAPVQQVFRLQQAGELKQAERRYLAGAEPAHAVVLAATRGSALRELTRDRPKVMLPVGDKTLIERLVDNCKRQSIHDITVVGGYKAEAIACSGIHLCVNPRHADSGELTSLLCAREQLAPHSIILYGDLLFRSYILQQLLDARGECVAVVDSAAHASGPGREDHAWCSRRDDRSLFDQEVQLLRVARARAPDEDAPSGRWIGMLRVTPTAHPWLLQALAALQRRDDFHHLNMPELINRIIADGHPVHAHYIHGHWMDVNELADVSRAGGFIAG